MTRSIVRRARTLRARTPSWPWKLVGRLALRGPRLAVWAPEGLVELAVGGPGVDGGPGRVAVAVDVDDEVERRVVYAHGLVAVDGVALGVVLDDPVLVRAVDAGLLVQLVTGHAVGGEAHAAVGVLDQVGGSPDGGYLPFLVGLAVVVPLDHRRPGPGGGAGHVEAQPRGNGDDGTILLGRGAAGGGGQCRPAEPTAQSQQAQGGTGTSKEPGMHCKNSFWGCWVRRLSARY